MSINGWTEFDAKTIAENYEDLAKEIEPITGSKDNHFETIMNFVAEYKRLKGLDCVHHYTKFGDHSIRRCHKCDKLEEKGE